MFIIKKLKNKISNSQCTSNIIPKTNKKLQIYFDTMQLLFDEFSTVVENGLMNVIFAQSNPTFLVKEAGCFAIRTVINLNAKNVQNAQQNSLQTFVNSGLSIVKSVQKDQTINSVLTAANDAFSFWTVGGTVPGLVAGASSYALEMSGAKINPNMKQIIKKSAIWGISFGALANAKFGSVPGLKVGVLTSLTSFAFFVSVFRPLIIKPQQEQEQKEQSTDKKQELINTSSARILTTATKVGIICGANYWLKNNVESGLKMGIFTGTFAAFLVAVGSGRFADQQRYIMSAAKNQFSKILRIDEKNKTAIDEIAKNNETIQQIKDEIEKIALPTVASLVVTGCVSGIESYNRGSGILTTVLSMIYSSVDVVGKIGYICFENWLYRK